MNTSTGLGLIGDDNGSFRTLVTESLYVKHDSDFGSISFDSIGTNLIPSIDNTYNIGSNTFRWKDLHAVRSMIPLFSTVSSDITFNPFTNIVKPFTDGAIDFGSSANRWKDIYANRSFISTLATDSLDLIMSPASFLVRPPVTWTYDLGSEDYNWNNFHTLRIYTPTIGTSFTSPADLKLYPSTNVVRPFNNGTMSFGTSAHRWLSGYISLMFTDTIGNDAVGGHLNLFANSGIVKPTTDNATDLGKTDFRWKDIHALRTFIPTLSTSSSNLTISPSTNIVVGSADNTLEIGTSTNNIKTEYVNKLILNSQNANSSDQIDLWGLDTNPSGGGGSTLKSFGKISAEMLANPPKAGLSIKSIGAIELSVDTDAGSGGADSDFAVIFKYNNQSTTTSAGLFMTIDQTGKIQSTCTTNQIVLNYLNTRQVTLNFPHPTTGVARTYSMPTDVANSNFVMSEGAATINGAKTLSSALTITPTTNQLVLGTTNTTTISSTAPAASRVVTLPDAGTNSSILLTEGSQTINGSKTFSVSTAFTGVSGGITLPTTGGTPATLDFYELTSYSTTFSAGTGAVSASFTINIVRMGVMVTMLIPGISITGGAGTYNQISSVTAMAARFCPGNSRVIVARVHNNGGTANGYGVIQVQASGVFNIFRTDTSAIIQNWNEGTVMGTTDPVQISYIFGV
jgi:hypothetical protein